MSSLTRFIPALLALCAIGVLTHLYLSSITALQLDPYWRHQGYQWTTSILNSGRITLNPFDQPGLAASIDEFYPNTIAPLLVAVLSQITGAPIAKLYLAPLFVVPLILFQALIMFRLLRDKTAALITSALFLSIPYYYYFFDFAPHRIAFNFLVFDVIVFLMILNSQEHRSSTTGLLIFFQLFFITLYSTMATTAVIFFASYYVLQYKRTRELSLGIMYGVGVLLYYVMMSDFLALPIGSFVGSSGLSNLWYNVFHFQTVQSLVPSALLPQRVPPWWYTLLATIAANFVYYVVRLSAVASLISIAINRKVRMYDALVISFVIYVVAVRPIQAALRVVSGGISGSFIEYLLAPILITNLLYAVARPKQYPPLFSRLLRTLRLDGKILSSIAVPVLVALIMISSLFTLAYLTGPEVRQTAVSEKQVDLSMWLSAYGHNAVVTSDVNFLGTYVAVGGNVPTWFPDPVAIANNGSIVFDFKGISLTYYAEPAVFVRNSSIVVVTDIMKATGVFSAGGVWTKPNPILTQELSASNDLVYDDGSNQAFA